MFKFMLAIGGQLPCGAASRVCSANMATITSIEPVLPVWCSNTLLSSQLPGCFDPTCPSSCRWGSKQTWRRLPVASLCSLYGTTTPYRPGGRIPRGRDAVLQSCWEEEEDGY